MFTFPVKLFYKLLTIYRKYLKVLRYIFQVLIIACVQTPLFPLFLPPPPPPPLTSLTSANLEKMVFMQAKALYTQTKYLHCRLR